MSLTYHNRVALVTGAGRGIGRAIAENLAEQGVYVLCLSKSKESCGDTAEGINTAGGKAKAYAVDVAEGEKVAQLAKSIINEFGRVDILINNVGITCDRLILRMSHEEWHTVLNTNLSSCFYWIKHLVHPMARNRWGRIVNISSVAGLAGNPGQAGYTAAKAGMIGLTKTIAREFASRNVTVNAVAPGFIETDMLAGLDEKDFKLILNNIPLRRLGKPKDVAHMVAYLCSEEADYITGQVFTVDGGMVM